MTHAWVFILTALAVYAGFLKSLLYIVPLKNSLAQRKRQTVNNDIAGIGSGADWSADVLAGRTVRN